MAETAVIVHADKTVMRITGLRVQGLDTRALEQLLAERLATAVRVIGVTGEAVEMDVYGAPDEAVLRDEGGSDYVYVVQDGAAVKRVVETGRQLSTAVEITDGLGRYEAVVWDAAALPGECAVRLAGEGEE